MVRIDIGMSELRRCLLKAGYPKQEPLKVSGFLLPREDIRSNRIGWFTD